MNEHNNFYSHDIVNTNIDYTYDIMEKDIHHLKARYPFIRVGVAGHSIMGRKLYYVKLGHGSNRVFYNGAHHSLEWITSVLLMKFTENFAKAYEQKINILQYDINRIWQHSTIYILPMVNPDGIDIVLNGIDASHPYYHNLISWNNDQTSFREVWQANIHGVDLNHNYNASWQLSSQAASAMGIKGPGPTRYSGSQPESEPESKAVADFTRAHDFSLVLAYHSQGEVIYWDYQNMAPPQAKDIGKRLSKVSGYTMEEITGIASYGGYKDWFIQQYRRPGYTIEVGKGKNPLPISQFDKIYKDNEELLLLAGDIAGDSSQLSISL